LEGGGVFFIVRIAIFGYCIVIGILSGDFWWQKKEIFCCCRLLFVQKCLLDIKNHVFLLPNTSFFRKNISFLPLCGGILWLKKAIF
jgi:hypothetical protein